MQKIEIETTQNVPIEFEVASIGDRLLALLLDYLIIAGYFIALFIMLGIVGFNLGIASWIILIIPVFFYDLILEIFLNGQSFGKRIRKIKVVKINGNQAAFLDYFLRWILRPVDITFTYGSVAIITILINGRGQRLGDLAAKTTVIKLRNEASLNDTILADLKSDYQVVFPQVNSLNDSDIGLIKEVINQVQKIPDLQTYNNILQKSKDVIEKKIGVKSSMNSLSFLNTIIKDYNYLNIK